ncbi:HAD family hydrolase [uncultured Anaerococcus sp.]|uniref:HAD family hydrolase n=1 Tax=uncultured Anaerococcus sp. TaxID=293428 RepID=UPI002639DE68|nr:HAD family hydrolase [uncultured Anaerococcus sp.]
MIKLFAMDMDGTLLNSNNEVNASSKEAIKKLNESGVKTVLCSGRVMTSLENINAKLETDNPMVANNGAIIKLNSKKILNIHPLEDDHLKEVIKFCHYHKFMYHFYDEDTFYSNRLDFNRLHHLKKDSQYGLNYQCNISISDNPFQVMKEKDHNAMKILVGSLIDHPYGEKKSIELIKEEFKDKLYITSSGWGSIEIMEPHVNKWQGILELIEFLGIKEDEIAAIGDSDNDLPMISKSKLGFAMGNANDVVKNTASHIVSDNNSTGINEAADLILKFNKDNPSV